MGEDNGNKPADEAPGKGKDRMVYNIEHINSGIAISLAGETPFWRLESGAVELNAFTGKVSAVVPKDMSDFDKMTVVAGLNYGRIAITDKVRDEKPAVRDTAKMMEPMAIESRKILDLKVSEIQEALQRVHSVELCETCLIIEKTEYGREGVQKLINSRLKELA